MMERYDGQEGDQTYLGAAVGQGVYWLEAPSSRRARLSFGLFSGLRDRPVMLRARNVYLARIILMSPPRPGRPLFHISMTGSPRASPCIPMATALAAHPNQSKEI